MSERKEFDAEKLADLLARVQAATGESYGINYDVCLVLGYSSPPVDYREYKGNVSGSIDAALALVEKMLPGSDWSIDCRDEGDAERWFDVTVGVAFVQHRSAPLAILAALLTALSSTNEAGK